MMIISILPIKKDFIMLHIIKTIFTSFSFFVKFIFKLHFILKKKKGRQFKQDRNYSIIKDIINESQKFNFALATNKSFSYCL